jgi:hypothetical protein
MYYEAQCSGGDLFDRDDDDDDVEVDTNYGSEDDEDNDKSSDTGEFEGYMAPYYDKVTDYYFPGATIGNPEGK